MARSVKTVPLLLFSFTVLASTHTQCMKQIKAFINSKKQERAAQEDAKLHAEFFAAAETVDSKRLQQLLENPKVDVMRQDPHGNTALHLIARSCAQSPTACIHLLIEHRAQVNAQNNDGNTPLHIAAARDDYDMTPVFDCITKLIEKGATLNALNKTGELPLHLAIQKGDADTSELLLKLGADPNERGHYGNTPLYTAFMLYSAPDKSNKTSWTLGYHIRNLLAAGACINTSDLYNLEVTKHHLIINHVYIPFLKAIQEGNIPDVERYLNQGASLSFDIKELPWDSHRSFSGHQAYFDKYPLNLATNCTEPRPEMVRFLIDKGALGGVGFDIVRNAFMYGNIDMARLIFAHVPQRLIREQWNNVAIPLLCCKVMYILPRDIRNLLCLYAVKAACTDDMIKRNKKLFEASIRVRKNERYFTVEESKTIEFQALNSKVPKCRNLYEYEFGHILDNIPTWQEQIKSAILKVRTLHNKKIKQFEQEAKNEPRAIHQLSPRADISKCPTGN